MTVPSLRMWRYSIVPGRSLVGRAGVTLYRVGVVKQASAELTGAVRQIGRRPDAVAILVVRPADPQVGVVGPFLGRETQDPLDLWAHVRRGHRAG